MSDIHSLRTRRDRRAWARAIRRLARRAARHAGIDLRPAALLPLIALVAAPGALAFPTGAQVVSGNVSIGAPANSTMAITQGSQKGIVNWNSFSIGGNETVNITQPSPQAVLLNRVVGSNASTIAGRLNANGQVFLVNPAGVLFAKGASVNVGSLVASTLGISDSDFLAGKYHFIASPNASGKVVNQGAITAGEGGTVALLGGQVDNSGVVSAKLGTVAMGAGSDITLDFAGDGLTMLKVDGAAAQALVSNSGVVQADGGQVVMSVQTADALAATVLNQTGTVRARSVAERNGRIVLDGGAAGVTEVAGAVDATGGAGMKGGGIDVTGFRVAVNDGARVDANGAAGGGRVRVGGGAAGKAADIRNADAVWMSPTAQVGADALVSGDGGNIVMYGTEAARIYGTLSAKGGAHGGNGGLIETSGGYLDTHGATIDATAALGRGGEWLLDPTNLTVIPATLSTTPSTTVNSGTSISTTTTSNPNVATFSSSPTSNSVVVDDDISNKLGSGISVTLSTDAGNLSERGTGAIIVENGVRLAKTRTTTPATLTLSAAGSITVEGTIGGPSAEGDAPVGALNVVLDANQGKAAAGTNWIVLNRAVIDTNGGYFTAGVPAAAAGTPAAATQFDGAAVVIGNNTKIDTTVALPGAQSGGSVTLNGQGAPTLPSALAAVVAPNATPLAAFTMIDSTIATSTGDVSIAGQAAPLAVSIGGLSGIATQTGNIGINGTVGTRANDFANLNTTGVALTPTSASTVTTPLLKTVSGNISVSGAAAVVPAALSTVSGVGVSIQPDLGRQIAQSESGNISIVGTAPYVNNTTDRYLLDGTGVSIVGAALATQTGSIFITGNAPGLPRAMSGDFAGRSDGVGIDSSTLSAGNALSMTGTTASGYIPGAGVTITSGSTTPTAISAGAGGIQISGSGNGYQGVAMNGGFPYTITQDIDIHSVGGPIDIRGYNNGLAVAGNLYPGVELDNAGITAQGSGLTVSVTGYTPSSQAGIALYNSTLSAGRDPALFPGFFDTGGTVVLRADNNGTTPPIVAQIQTVAATRPPVLDEAVNLRGDDAVTAAVDAPAPPASTFYAPSGTVVMLPGKFDAGSFNIAADNLTPINVGGTAAGFSVTQSMLGAIAPAVSNLIIGSNSYSGLVTVAQPFFGTGQLDGLTLASGGTGSKGIALASLINVDTLTLQTPGIVTQGASGIQVGQLNLVGPGSFNFTNPANFVGSLGLAGTGNVTLVSQGDLRITGVAGQTFDSASAKVTPLESAQATLLGNLNVQTLDGGEGGKGTIYVTAPVVENATGVSTLGLHANNLLFLQNDITSTAGALDVAADARNAIIALGNAGEGAEYRIRFATNGGSLVAGTQGGGASGYDGASAMLESVDIDTTGASGAGGNVTLHGIAPTPAVLASSSFPNTITPYGVDLNDVRIFSGTGQIEVAGRSLNAATDPGGGVVLRNAGTAPARQPASTQLVSTASDSDSHAVRVFGSASGGGNNGVAVLDGSSVRATNGTADIRGSANTTGYGVLLGSGSVTGRNVAIAGYSNSATAGVGIATTGETGGNFTIAAPDTVVLGSANDASATSLIGRGAPGSISAATLGIYPVSVDPTSFALTPRNGMPITLFGTAATPGLSIDATTYQSFSTNIRTLALGSLTQTGKITVEGPCAGGTNCAARPFVATSLTLQNPGAGSQGVDLPSGIAMPLSATLAIDTNGTASDPGGIQTGTLLLAGGGVFNLPDVNSVNTLAVAGTGTVNFRNAGALTIGTASATGFDAASGNAAPIGGQPGTATGDLTVIADSGGITLGTPATPMHLTASGSIDLVQQGTQFQNPNGGTISAGNAWRVWALNRDNETRGGIEPGGARPNFYGCVHGGNCWNGQLSNVVVTDNGNHFVYAEQPTLTINVGNQKRPQGLSNPAFTFTVAGLQNGDTQGQSLAGGPPGSTATTNSGPGSYAITGTFTSPDGYKVVVIPGTLTIDPSMPLQGAVFARSGLQPLFTAQEDSFVYESNLGAINVCVGTNEPVLALQQSEGPADSLASEWKRVRSRPNLNNCLVVNGQHGCGEF
ncbi:filamentous hemagglutinin N-terminal domain-containing protein [Caballeronia sp. TF1N1]|uniref:two-partner secretion domain-containing protein n=1 Tax=Caballeronia sp. TF1N1 TaxID=2878153 RepID=UPI001FD0F1D5|nr:filamentous hemagglutinin N-terminal domain-containing protein [Caballeronia sp. TF1N1]